MVHNRPAKLPALRRLQRLRPRRGWHWQPLLRPQGRTSPATWQSRAEVRSISRVWGGNAHPPALLLHARRALARLYLVRTLPPAQKPLILYLFY